MGRMRTAFNAAMAAIVAAFMVIMSIQAYKELFVRETEPPVKQPHGHNKRLACGQIQAVFRQRKHNNGRCRKKA